MSRDLAFVSYSHRDAVWRDRIHVMLKPWIRNGLRYWADDYIPDGGRWKRRIDDALAQARVGVLLVSPDFLASDFIHEVELPALYHAADRGELVLFPIPVSASGYKATRLAEYQFAHDPSRPLDRLTKPERNAALVELCERLAALFDVDEPPRAAPIVAARRVRSVARMATGAMGELHGVPELPPHYLAREAELAGLKRLLARSPAVGVHAAPAAHVGLQGMGGVGKSVLALAAARDLSVRRAFSDGIYWLGIGAQPDSLRIQNSLWAMARGEGELRDVASGKDRLRQLLADKACLVILDDVWRSEHAIALDVLGPRGRLLITSRDRLLLDALGAESQSVGVLDRAAALRLLAEWSGARIADLPPAAAEVAAECGDLPLALSLAAAQVRAGVGWEAVLRALRAGRLEFLDHPYGSVFKSISASVRALPEDELARYGELAFIPEDTAVPTSTIAVLWRHGAGLSEAESRRLLARLAGKGLLLLGREEDPEVRLHDLQLDYLRLIDEDQAATHGRLLDAFAARLTRGADGSPRWASLPLEARYLWQHLGHHLLAAGRSGELEASVRNAEFLQALVAARGVSAMLAMLTEAAERVPSKATRAIEHALRLESGWLHQDPSALPALLYNRLRSEPLTPAEIATLVANLDPPVRLRHPVRMGGGELRIFRGHTGSVTACAYSPDGKRILSASWDGTLREWDRESGKEVRRFEGHSHWVDACAYSPDGKRTLSASRDKTLREWDRESGKELRRFEGHYSAVLACVYSPDGSRVLSASRDNTLREWDRESGNELRCFEGHSSEVGACAYSPDGKRILSASDDNTLREWDRESGKELRRFEGHSRSVTACAYSPDGKRILSASDDDTLREWDRESGKQLRRFEGHSRSVMACAYSPDGKRILSASDDDTLREWDRESGNELRCLEGHSRSVTACAYSPDGKRILSASDDDTLREWDRESGNELRRFEGHSRSVMACAYSPDGERILSASGDATLREWDRESGKELRRFEGHYTSVTACAYKPDGKRILSASDDNTVREWDRESGKELRRFRRHSIGVTAFAYSPDGKRILSASDDDTLREWDPESGRELRRFEGHDRWITACTYSPDGKRILTASADHTLREWDRESGQELRCFERHSSFVRACAYSPLREWLVSASSDSTIKIWDRRTGACLYTVFGGAAFNCAAAREGEIAAGDEAGNLWIIEIRDDPSPRRLPSSRAS